ncbi:hypothetical protein [Stenotrophomonas sp. PS02300]|uniref:hypothetical protein n=1 Tax=Stenotrophomonas sp. PS02300 TaxID=2991426 RepID=UPI00249A7AE1|nr:hypothetical protein [Stenotrophomonas sp. PS02300]
MKAVIDTNVILVANNQHKDVSGPCVLRCIDRLTKAMNDTVVVIDDGYRILGEYQNKTSLSPPKGVGDVFLKWLLRNAGNERFVEQVALSEHPQHFFREFPCPGLEPWFDPPDRKFAATANAHVDKPCILQAADCKWLDWWQELHDAGVTVDFICPDDACRFYKKKFPLKVQPPLPELAR